MFAVTVIGTLAVGIGVNAAVFAISSAYLFRGFPQVASNDRVAYIASVGAYCCLSYPDFLDWRARSTSFSGMEVVHGFPVTLTDDRGFPESFDVTEVSAGAFGLIGRAPLIGRDFVAADNAPGAERVGLLSHGFWQRRYGGDASIVGATVRIDGQSTRIIGVMPSGFTFPQKQEMWLNIVPTADVLRRDNRNLWFAFGRLRDGVTIEAADAEIAAIGRQLESEYPTTNRDQVPEALTFNEFFVGGNESVLYASMWGAVAFVLLIACGNLANLMLARAAYRFREIAVRSALGAGRSRIVRQLLTESVALSALGAVAGWFLAGWIVGAYERAAIGPGAEPWRVLDYTMDSSIVFYVALVAVGTGVAFGLAPALRLARLDVSATLQAGGRSGIQGRTGRLSSVLVVAQVALAIVLLAGAGMMLRSFLNVSGGDIGIVTRNVMTAAINLPAASYQDAPARRAFFDALRERVEGLPGVDSVALANILPTWGSVRMPYAVEGEEAIDAVTRPRAAAIVISPDYLRTLGATLLSGRSFTDADDGDSTPVAVVNQRFAEQEWPGAAAVGQRLLIAGEAGPTWHTVVGVFSNIVQNDPTRQRVEPVIYLPYRQQPPSRMWVVARAAVLPVGMAAGFREAVGAIDANLPLRSGPYALEERLAERYREREVYAAVFVGFAVIALLLAAVGLYAVVAHAVSQHTQEFGVRMAIGATRRHIAAQVAAIGLKPIAIGLAVGLLLSLALTRVLQSELVDVSPVDPYAYLAACLALGLAACWGCLIPARRALRVDPVLALRQE